MPPVREQDKQDKDTRGKAMSDEAEIILSLALSLLILGVAAVLLWTHS